ncbi:GPO family capsid scaffolding protein [Rahnella sp. FC061912-K]|uniref:GPO family capsid scaffolding protein n=1 Tax=Rahnella rivi TaxID=2816249 RepID=UPI001C256A6D|nr:GPO family capsid scaffolding protein [Rahnella rivi]MBU9832474.1 GPO family capsid scaffolding protein [Rahnella rivi]
MAKKVSKWFRIGVEGDTCDGREIDANDIKQMAETYSAKAYGARVNLEHIKSVLPTSDFRRYGDVIQLKAEQINDAAEPLLHEKWALYAMISPTADLTQMVGDGQKVYTSMEIKRNFANSNKSYLVGLAVTDDPASLGTEMLEFSRKAKQNPLAGRKSDPDSLFTVATEALIEFEDAPETAPSLFALVKQKLSRKQASDDARLADVHEAVSEVAQYAQTGLDKHESSLTELLGRVDTLEKTTAADHEAFAALKNTLTQTSAQKFGQRPQATGGAGADETVTDC